MALNDALVDLMMELGPEFDGPNAQGLIGDETNLINAMSPYDTAILPPDPPPTPAAAVPALDAMLPQSGASLSLTTASPVDSPLDIAALSRLSSRAPLVVTLAKLPSCDDDGPSCDDDAPPPPPPPLPPPPPSYRADDFATCSSAGAAPARMPSARAADASAAGKQRKWSNDEDDVLRSLILVESGTALPETDRRN